MPEEDNGQRGNATPRFVLDLDTLKPGPRGVIKIGQKSYEVWSLMDVPLDDSMEVIKIQEKMSSATLSERLEMTKKLLRLLVPTLPEDVIAKKLTARSLLNLYNQAMEVQDNPPVPGVSVPEASSAEGSPLSPGSTAGAS